MKTILHLCADIGSDSKPYTDNGYNVIKIGKEIGVENYSPEGEIYGIIANPPCTEFSIAKGYNATRNLQDGLFLVKECLRIISIASPKFWVIENPATGLLKNFLGKPQFTYEPWQYGTPYTKKTALWGVFNIPPIKYHNWEEVPKNPNLYIRPSRKKPSLAFLHKSAINHIEEFACFKELVKDDMSFRSLCSQNFAKAFFEANR
jgi:hypothetical protein